MYEEFGVFKAEVQLLIELRQYDNTFKKLMIRINNGKDKTILEKNFLDRAMALIHYYKGNISMAKQYINAAINNIELLDAAGNYNIARSLNLMTYIEIYGAELNCEERKSIIKQIEYYQGKNLPGDMEGLSYGI